MAAFVSLLEAVAILHNTVPCGIEPARPMAHKTIALTTELKEPYMLGHS